MLCMDTPSLPPNPCRRSTHSHYTLYTHTHTNIHTLPPLHTHTHTHTHTHAHSQANKTPTHACMHTYARTHACAHTHTHTHTHTQTHTEFGLLLLLPFFTQPGTSFCLIYEPTALPASVTSSASDMERL